MKLVRLMAAMASALAIGMLPTAASAAPYPAVDPQINVQDATPELGEPVLVVGERFQAGEHHEIIIDYQGTAGGRAGRSAGTGLLGARDERSVVRADGDGTFQTTVTFDQLGRAVVTATGLVSGRSDSVTVMVVADDDGVTGGEGDSGDPGDGSSLPQTGVDGGTYLRLGLFGLGAVAVGALLVVAAARRRRIDVDQG